MNYARLGILLLMIAGFAACDNEEESGRDMTMRLLTGNTQKDWSIYEYFIDDQNTDITQCDSSYLLSMKADFTWVEQYINLQCYQKTTGSWALNDENTVISIFYTDWSSGQQVEKKFEIVELSEEYFTYQFPVNNRMKRIRLFIDE